MSGATCNSSDRIDGKIVIVTGGNTGIGKETIEDLLKRGAKVYMACRSLERAQQAANDIKNKTSVDDTQLIVMRLDLNSLKSVREFVTEFKTKEQRLDILINNAGVMVVPEGKTEDGFETTFGVNHLGHFLLTHLLMDLLVSHNQPARIINVSSLAHKFGKINFDDLMYTKRYFGFYASWEAYCQSKLANVLFTRELAHRLEGTKVTSYSLHPGSIQTELSRHIGIIWNYEIGRVLTHILTWPFMKDPVQGAQTTICCAVDKSLETHSGKYYSDCAEEEPSSEGLDDVTAKKLWDVSIDLVKLQASEIHEKLR